MEAIKNSVIKVKNNPIGAIGGAVLTYVALKKIMPGKSLLVTGLLIAAGTLVGASIQSGVKARASAPTKQTIEE